MTASVKVTKGKQKLYIAAFFAAAIAVLQIFASDATYAPWATIGLAVLGTLGTYLVPNKPYINP